MRKTQDLPKVKEHEGAGHRKRLRIRFLEAGLDGFLDYEVVELLLTLGTPRKDCKQMAKAAVKKFKSLTGVLETPCEELQQIKGLGPANIFGINFFQALLERHAKEKIPTSAAQIILAHNHPSGDPEPSEDDREVNFKSISYLL